VAKRHLRERDSTTAVAVAVVVIISTIVVISIVTIVTIIVVVIVVVVVGNVVPGAVRDAFFSRCEGGGCALPIIAFRGLISHHRRRRHQRRQHGPYAVFKRFAPRHACSHQYIIINIIIIGNGNTGGGGGGGGGSGGGGCISLRARVAACRLPAHIRGIYASIRRRGHPWRRF
jgi:hypothetical protein